MNTSNKTGIHLSWPALAVILSAMGLLAALANSVRSRDMQMIDTKISALQKEVSLGREDRLRSQEVITATLMEQGVVWDRRLARIESRIDVLISNQHK